MEHFPATYHISLILVHQSKTTFLVRFKKALDALVFRIRGGLQGRNVTASAFVVREVDLLAGGGTVPHQLAVRTTQQ